MTMSPPHEYPHNAHHPALGHVDGQKPTPLVHVDSQQMCMDDKCEREHRPNREHRESGINPCPAPTTREREHAGE
jgi:hypothetical protein